MQIYLNKEWKEEYGGHFELWDKNMKECKKKILPSINKLAIFSTTYFSYHGHPDPLNCSEDRSRKSLALYYYSNGRPSNEINIGLEEHSTILHKRKNSNLDTTFFKKNNIQLLKDFAKEILPPFIFKKLQDKN